VKEFIYTKFARNIEKLIRAFMLAFILHIKSNAGDPLMREEF